MSQRSEWTTILAGYIAFNHPGFDLWVTLTESKEYGTATIWWAIVHRHYARGTSGILYVEPGTSLKSVATDVLAQLEVAVALLGLSGG